MEIKVAKNAGFCFGVRRAVELANTLSSEGKPVYTYGEIIHNETVVKELEEKGVKVVNNLDELKEPDKGTLIIRSHGIPKSDYDKLSKMGVCYKDATCPFVKKIHKLAREYSENFNNQIVIVGAEDHPEVVGIKGWCLTEPVIIGNVEEALNYSENSEKTHVILAQTTFNLNKFQDIVEIFKKKRYYSIVLNTICNATAERQTETEKLAEKADAMIVVGGRHSSNTQKLYDICIKKCVDTYYIHTPEDLDLGKLKKFRCVGITAGASTPNNIIEEVRTKMAEMSFAEMLEQEESLKNPVHTGAVVKGQVIAVKEDEIIFNIGYKADGILTKNEYSNTPTDLTTVAKVGDEMEVKVLKLNDGDGQVLLTYKRLAAEKGNKRLEEAFNNKEVLKAKVTQVLNGGLSVVVDEARVFIPASLVSDTYEKNLDKYAGEEIEFVISEFNPKKRRVIGDRKQILAARKSELKKALFDKLAVGQVVDGKVKNVTDFGAFIDLGGADGLLHISEMSWGHIENPKKVFKVDDMVKSFVKDIQGEKIALSLKFEDQNPWAGAEEKFAVGNIVSGKVARMTDFGAFIELEPGVDALLHVSQIAANHVEKPSDVLKTGEEVTAKIVDFNAETKKISLSIKALLVGADEAEEKTSEDENQAE
ncbi:MAG: bifunctional 4-hydroxy-3-methylbut-2-enyl diphosphate reductase/30S ribosomal protein S1 [Catonella sp.]|uniref:bifunctional 4-hydroxy-3-methylbut-2-enyl diphosphate reductase/30S ribosomal protein S1 n=1 Tax=Catonella sp. TaxID=2382125 RepID=UPI003F9F91B1